MCKEIGSKVTEYVNIAKQNYPKTPLAVTKGFSETFKGFNLQYKSIGDIQIKLKMFFTSMNYITVIYS